MDRYLRLSVNDYEFTHAGPCGSGVFISAGTFRKTGFIRRKNVIKWKDIKGGRNMVIRETKKGGSETGHGNYQDGPEAF